MGRKKEPVDRPLKSVPELIHLTVKEGEETQYRECMYCRKRRIRDTAANRAVLYRAICIYRTTASMLPC